jgi:hypothetical protein
MNDFHYTVYMNETLVAGSHALPEMVGVFSSIVDREDAPASEVTLRRQAGPHAVPVAIVKRKIGG